MRTKLRAVQEVMRRVGKHPCQALDRDGVSVESHIERVLDDAVHSIQQEGWYWNTRYDVKLTPDSSTKKIEVGRLVTESDLTFSTATRANPCVVTTTTAHGLESGQRVYIKNLVGMTQLNDRYFTVGPNPTSTTFTLEGEDSTSHGIPIGDVGTVTPLRTIFHVDSTHEDAQEEVTRQGEFLYDVADNTEEFTGTLQVRYVYERPFEEIPVAWQDYAISCAALNYNRMYVGNRNADGMLQLEKQRTQTQVMREQIRVSDVNVLGTEEMKQIRGRRRMQDRSVY